MDNLGYSYSYTDDDDDDKPPAYDVSTTTTVPVQNNNSTEAKQKQLGDGEEGDHYEVSTEEEIIPGRCGIFCWKPQWMQRFPTKHWFIAVFLLATTIKGMSGSYFLSTISSVEKRLKVSTETIGYITSGNEISQILLSLILSYFGGKGHRPRWMAFGIFASAVSYFLHATPHFLYGPGNEALSVTAEYYSQFHNNASDMSDLFNFTTRKNLTADLGASEVCKINQENPSAEVDCGLGDNSIVPLGLIFLSQFVAGIGSVLLYTLAGPFIDDHMKPLQAPVMIAMTGAVRQTGPLIGYVVAYFCLRLFVDPWLTPLISNKDDRWLGAWWLGSVIFAVFMGIVSFLMVLFPRVLRTATKKSQKKQEINLELNAAKTDLKITVRSEEPPRRMEPIFQQPTRDLTFWASFWDLMKNKTNTWNNLAILCFGFAFSGFGTYFPKYLETVIKQNAANAALTTGLSSIFFQVAGLLLSGFVIARFRLRARTLAGMNVIVDIVIVGVVFSFSQLVCKQGQVVDTSQITNVQSFYHDIEWGNNTMFSSANMPMTSSGQMPYESSCNSDCNCVSSQNTPVCYQDKNLIYYSACHAGCNTFDPVSHIYTNCSCLPSPDIALVPGKCVDPNSCYSTFIIFISLMAVVRFGSSFGRIGNVLIPYRCVDRSQKSLASGLSFAMWSIVSIPSPIMYGKIIDSACLRWGTKCGERGSCVLYDDTKFAYAMSVTAAGLATLGMFCDAMVWYYVKDLKLYGEEEDENSIEENKQQDNNNKGKEESEQQQNLHK